MSVAGNHIYFGTFPPLYVIGASIYKKTLSIAFLAGRIQLKNKTKLITSAAFFRRGFIISVSLSLIKELDTIQFKKGVFLTLKHRLKPLARLGALLVDVLFPKVNIAN